MTRTFCLLVRCETEVITGGSVEIVVEAMKVGDIEIDVDGTGCDGEMSDKSTTVTLNPHQRNTDNQTSEVHTRIRRRLRMTHLVPCTTPVYGDYLSVPSATISLLMLQSQDHRPWSASNLADPRFRRHHRRDRHLW